MNEQVGPMYQPSMVRAGILALLLIGVDCFLFNQGAIALLVAAWLVVIALPLALIRKRYAGVRLLRLRDVGILLAGAVVVIPINMFQNQVARERATTLIAAVNAYHEKEGAWPATLETLVPRYIESVPRAKYAILFGDFRYRASAGATWLEYTSLPPFGRPVYNFEKQRWNYLD
jgi:hypothetical protein